MRTLLNRLSKLEKWAVPTEVCLWDNFRLPIYVEGIDPEPIYPDCSCQKCRLIAQGRAERRITGIKIVLGFSEEEMQELRERDLEDK